MSYVRELRALVGHRPLIIAGAAVLIFDHCDRARSPSPHRLLLQLRQDNKQWGLIGGSMEIGESLEETAKREAFEETGLILNRLDWFDLFSGSEYIYQCPNKDVVVNVVAVYTSSQFQGQLRIDKQEGIELRFFELDKLPINISPPDKPVIDKYLSNFEVR